MRRFFAIIGFSLVAATLLAWLLFFRSVVDPLKLIENYQTSARTPIFSGFVTLGSFLLTLKTTIIQRLKDAYDTDEYADKFLELRAKHKDLLYYGSLSNLGTALAANICLSLSTSAVQMTLGFVKHPVAISICIGFAATTLGLVLYLTVQMSLAHKDWFRKIEADRIKTVLERNKAGNDLQKP